MERKLYALQQLPAYFKPRHFHMLGTLAHDLIG